ncbi:survival motor neuron interacting protein 1-domain-containing protein [Mucidula mucida]|nr:survival motor neuron interacting protein 1-domain-containing protein [Mucidula mucida]
MSKRPRDDSDDDEPALGRQILPVANLPANFDGVPTDGLQYLFTVRRDARKLPHITRVVNPYEINQSIRPSAPSSTSHPSLPSEEWRVLFRERFGNLRKNVTQPTANVQLPQVPARQLMPDKQDRELWWAFLSGKPETEWNPPKQPKQRKIKPGMRAFREETLVQYQVPMTDFVMDAVGGKETLDTGEEATAAALAKPVPRPLTPVLLQHIDQRMSLHLLMYFTHWINLHLNHKNPPFPRLADVHAQWIFFLLTRIDDYISADDTSLLRNLVRACLSLVKVMLRDETAVEEGSIALESCWIIVTTIIGVWGQQDLWMDAESMLGQ